MKTIFQAFVIAFSMYSKIPMPKVKWEEKGMKYAICFFPLVGVVAGTAEYYLAKGLYALGAGELLRGTLLAVFPILLSGGIHLDGFLDTMDGLASYAEREKRLEILSDSNSGAFAVIGGMVYFLVFLSCLSEVPLEQFGIIGISFVVSRALSGLALVTFRKAKKDGLAAAFSDRAHKKTVIFFMGLWLFVCVFCGFVFSVTGGIVLVFCSLFLMGYHYYNCMHNFGGITGDLAGYFLQIFELSVAAVLVVVKYYSGG